MTWYTTVSIPESKQFMDMFEKQYPLIKVDLLRSGSGDRTKSFSAARAAASSWSRLAKRRSRSATGLMHKVSSIRALPSNGCRWNR